MQVTREFFGTEKAVSDKYLLPRAANRSTQEPACARNVISSADREARLVC
jgi:hypothetical protein